MNNGMTRKGWRMANTNERTKYTERIIENFIKFTTIQNAVSERRWREELYSI